MKNCKKERNTKMIDVLAGLKADEHYRNASYATGKADLCGDLLEQLPSLDPVIRDMLYAIQRTERQRAISELQTSLKVRKGE